LFVYILCVFFFFRIYVFHLYVAERNAVVTVRDLTGRYTWKASLHYDVRLFAFSTRAYTQERDAIHTYTRQHML
jgi:hypothetical protein